ncbi:MCE family protein [Aphanothece hegewaldii CCALA 016]|uniref:MCE family protein n=1 Tax=Aphanothece hegewaldii CCALA 016 TaxID=2107694 RepID=A0A2T1LWH6_9CHRO|nr:MlaD family protein [Aphanothece hegewaldii]PSF36257.1 MCE family protein [Aphanothece hegewaldii CCALA 016]
MLRSRAIREGSIGIFALLGLIVFGGITIWLRGGGWGEKTYQFTTSFPTVDGMQIGAPVRFRGVTVGKIVDLQPGSNKVEATIEISSASLQIPKNVVVTTNRYGLIGDASVDILPLTKLPPDVPQISPLSEDCDSNLVICQGDRLSGENAPDIFASMIQLAETYSDQAFVDNLNSATKNASVAAARLARLTDDAAIILRSAQKDISTVTKEISSVSQSATKTAADTSRLINNANSVVTANGIKVTKTVDETSQLVSNLNVLIGANRSKLVETIDRIYTASSELNNLASNLNTTVGTVNQTLDQTDTQALVQNLQTLTANAAEASANLRDLSKSFNDPTIVVTLQQTLDSARVTFANTQKLTSDLDEILGDPKLRENIRILINGLSNLVSSADHLEEQIRIAKSLELAQQNLQKTTSNKLELNDFQPQSSDDFLTQPKIIDEKQQKLKAIND